MLRIVRHPERAAQMGEASLRIAQGHAETHTFSQYEALYRRLLPDA